METYVHTHLKTYKLNAVMARQIRKNLEYEYEDIGCGFYPEAKYEERAKAYKTYFLKREYFSKHPEKSDKYNRDLTVQEAPQLCDNGGFENGLGQYTFTHAASPSPYPGYQINTLNNSDFTGFTPSSNLNVQNVPATLVSNGFDGIVPFLSRTNNGNRAVRLNYIQTNGLNTTVDVTTMSRTFICDESTFNYSFSVVLENPYGHSDIQQPFFRTRIYDQNNVVVRENSVFADSDDCFFTEYENAPQNLSTVLYSGWVCDQIDIAPFMGQQITVEFVIGDCTKGAHAGEVYIDDICGTNCADPVSGSVNLDPIQTIECPTEPIEICGSYTLPAESVYDNIRLDLVHDGSTMPIMLSPTTLNQTANGGSFCFTVPLSVFGSNPYGTYDFKAVGQFTRQCTIQDDFPLDPIYDDAANDSGPDVSFIGCITANDDNKTFSTCDLESFSVLQNDSVYGQQATINNVSISQVGQLNLYVYLNPSTGEVVFNNNTPPGSYTISYEICNTAVPQDCDQATVTITITPPEIIANNDDFSDNPINGCDGGHTNNLLINDTYCGVSIWFNINISHQLWDNGGLTGASMDAAGNIVVPANSSPGSYTLTYGICDDDSPQNCDTAQAVVVVAPGETPTFDFLTTICRGSVPPDLPSTSTNDITGTWTPAQVDNEQTGTYTFTPDEECSVPVDVTITILPDCGLSLQWDSEVNCQEANNNARKGDFDADIVDGPCLRFCESSTVAFSISGNTQDIDHTDWSVTGGNIQNESITTCEVQWTDADFSFIDVTVTMTDGNIKHLHICVEKLPLPTADFNVNPPAEKILACVKSPVFFENLSTPNGGNDQLYYFWDFGDGATSTEFEPSHTYEALGSYTVKLVVSNGCSCSDITSRKVIVRKPLGPIECIGVVCAGDVATYSIPTNHGCKVAWRVEGGEIQDVSSDNLTVSVLWDNVDSEGFGYLTVSSDCTVCATTAKIPVVTPRTRIKGKNEICAGQQASYTIPQWPTTEVEWTIDNNITGASLINYRQRNEIVVQADQPGIVHLICNYHNTLLGCGGSAAFDIRVNPEVKLQKPETVCKTLDSDFTFVDPQGTPLSSPVNYTITGPDNFSTSGHAVSFSQAFPEVGTYNVAIDSPDYCVDGFLSIEVETLPETPDDIQGDTTICPGVAYTYSTQVPNGATAHWEVQNGTILGTAVGSSVSVKFDPSASGPYQLSVYYETGGCPSEAYAITPEAETPDLSFTAGNDEVCGSSYATYTVADTIAETYEWSINPESAGSIEQGQNTSSVNILWNQEPQNATLKVKARKCSMTYENSYNVEIIGTPDIEIQGDTEACVGQSANFSISVLGGEGTFSAVEWDFGDGTAETTTDASINHSYEQPLENSTTYTVTATVIDPNGCAQPSSDTFVVEVSPTPVVTISPLRIDTCFTDNHTIAVDVQSGFSPTYTVQWFKNGATLPNQTGYTIDVDDPGLGAGTYYARVSNTFGCTEETQHVSVVTRNCNNESECPSIIIQTSATVVDCQKVNLDITGASLPTTELYFSGIDNLGGTATTDPNDPNHITVDGLEPGRYTVIARATYNSNGQECSDFKFVEFTVPYKAGVKYAATCGNNGQYNVQVLDHSVYYPGPQVSNLQYEFTTDGGSTWQNGILNNGEPQLDTQLAPGTYQLGVRISANGFAPCTAFTTLDLPGLPNANFTVDNPGCPGEALHFMPTATGPGLTYEWDFGEATNLQQNPAKTFTAGHHPVTLTVTNAFGCEVSHTETVTVPPSSLEGHLEADPQQVCAGGSITINYVLEPQQDTPVHFEWYRNTETEVPYAVTNGPSLTVSEDGQYYVYVTGANGCHKYNNPPTDVSFIPLPGAPQIEGDQVVCAGEDVVLSVTDIDGLYYKWERDGVPQPQWDGQAEITDQPTTPANYDYSVTVTVDAGDGLSCSGPAGHFTVNLVPPPNDPQLMMEVLSCDPYQVKVSVANPQPNLSYHWSNGDTGTQTTINHDGPLQVIARTNDCSASAQVDLPLDLKALAWTFPKGCYVRCKARIKFNFGYVVGPFGNFKEWAWNKEGNIVQSGTGTVDDFHGVSATHDYSLYLATEDCELTTDPMHISTMECNPCDKINYTLLDAECLTNGGFQGYQLKLQVNNQYGLPVTINLMAPYTQGYFVNNSFPAPAGTSTQVLYFATANSFNGPHIDLSAEAKFKDFRCQSNLNLPVPSCNFVSQPGHSPKDAPATDRPLLFAVPNPTRDHQTQVFYNTGKGESPCRIVVRDLFGRRLLGQPVKSGHGKIDLDCTRLAEGTYLICLQHGRHILKTSKLIVK